MEMFRSLSSKKKRSKRNKVGTCSSLPLDVPSSFYQSDSRSMDKLRFSWVKSESLEYGIFCGQSASWESTIYFKNGGSDEVYEYSIRYIWTSTVSCDCHVIDM